jgi:hypothetical protein
MSPGRPRWAAAAYRGGAAVRGHLGPLKSDARNALCRGSVVSQFGLNRVVAPLLRASRGRTLAAGLTPAPKAAWAWHCQIRTLPRHSFFPDALNFPPARLR